MNPLDAGHLQAAQIRVPFDATPTGQVLNYERALPKATYDVGKSIVQGLFRVPAEFGISAGQAGAAIADKLYDTNYLLRAVQPVPTDGFSALLGKEPLKGYGPQIEEMANSIRSSSFAQKNGLDTHALPLAFAGIVGGQSLNFIGGEGEEALMKTIAKETEPTKIFTTLVGAGVDKHIAAPMANHLATVSSQADVKATLDTIKGLHAVKEAVSPVTPIAEHIQEQFPHLPETTTHDIAARAVTQADKTPAAVEDFIQKEVEAYKPEKITQPTSPPEKKAAQRALPEIKAQTPAERAAQEQAVAGTIKKPDTAEEAAARYWQEVAGKSIKKDEPVVIGADDLKDHFGGDYADERHPVYSKAAFQLYERALKESPHPDVALLGGGPGSGKTEIIVNTLKKQGFKGVVYDSNAGTYQGLKNAIASARNAGKSPEIVGIIPDLNKARLHTVMREAQSGRGVSDEAFANGHVGFPDAVAQAIERGDIAPENVHLLDTRNLQNKEAAVAAIDQNKFSPDPLALTKGLAYTKEDVTREFSKTNAPYAGDTGLIRDTGLSGNADRSPGNDRADQGPGLAELDAGAKGGLVKGGDGEAAGLPPSIGEIIANGKHIPIERTPADALTEATKGPDQKSWQSLVKGYVYNAGPEKRAHIFDYLATPEFVLEKLGLGRGAEMLQDAKDTYRATLKKEFDQIGGWQDLVERDQFHGIDGQQVRHSPKDSARVIFQYLDGKEKEVVPFMSTTEQEVAQEIRAYLKTWADRLKLPEDNQISRYITHIFERSPGAPMKETFDDPELALIMNRQPAGSVYDPFLQKRVGKQDYIEDVWRALDAYVKRASRKEAMDPALETIANMAKSLDSETYKYVTSLTHRVNMRPTEIEQAMDSFLKQTPIGHRFTDRPTAFITRSIRQLFYRGTLGLNVSSALRNLTQGANTYAKLGEKYTVVGYAKLFNNMVTRNLDELYAQNILSDELVQDRNMGVMKKGMQRVDKGLFALFEVAEKINRGAAYWGAKAQAIDKGLSEEQAMKYAKRIVRETQFAFGAVDTPVWLNDDVVKTLTQLQSYNIKQFEFLSRMAKQKDFAGLVRWTAASLGMVYSIGRLFGMTPQQLIPTLGLGGAPVTSTAIGASQALSSDPQTHAKGVSQLQRNLMTLVPGGAQLRKTLQGAHDLARGKDVTATGRFRFRVPSDAQTRARVLLFGPSALPQAQEYYNSLGKKQATTGNPLN